MGRRNSEPAGWYAVARARRTPPAGPTRRFQLLPEDQPLFVWLAEITSVAGVLGFLAAIAINSAVFAGWGLNFIQLASATDVLMSGIAASGYLLVMGLAACGGYLIQQRTPRRYNLILNLFLLSTFVAAVWAYSADYIESGTMLLVIVAVLGAMTADLTLDMLHGPLSPALMALVGRWPAFIVWAAALSAVCAAQIGALQSQGYFPARRLLVEAAGCETPELLWLGDRAAVVRCPTGAVVISHPENLKIVQGH